MHDYIRIFTPNSPVFEKPLFVGRTLEVAWLKEAFHTPGVAPAIIGDRGIGKTSLICNAISEINHARVNCSRRSTFSKLFKSALSQLGVDISILESVIETGKEHPGIWKVSSSKISEKKTRVEIGQRELDMNILLDIFFKSKTKFVIVLDEYDRLPNDDSVKREIADLIKALSDHKGKHNCTIVLVGVARKLETLIGEHESIPRQIDELYLTKLTDKDLFNLVSEGEKLSRIKFDGKLKKEIVETACGMPYFVHLVCKELISTAKLRKDFDSFVKYGDLQRAKETAMKKAYRSILKKYKDVMKSFNDHEINLIRLINSIESRLYEDYLSGEFERYRLEGVFSDIIELFIEEKRILYRNPSNRKEFRFSEPLLGPFFRLQYGTLKMFNKDNGQTKIEFPK